MPPINWSHPRLSALSKPVPAWMSLIGAAGTFLLALIVMRWRQSMKLKVNQFNFQPIFSIVQSTFRSNWLEYDANQSNQLPAEEVRALLESSLNQAKSNFAQQEELARAITNQTDPTTNQSSEQSNVKSPAVVEMTEIIRSMFDRLHNQYQRIFSQWLLNLDNINIQAHLPKQPMKTASHSTESQSSSQPLPEPSKLSLDDHKESVDSPASRSINQPNNQLSQTSPASQDQIRRNALRTLDWKTTCLLYGCMVEKAIAQAILDKFVANSQ